MSRAELRLLGVEATSACAFGDFEVETQKVALLVARENILTCVHMF
jgi:hypothetical protein